MTLQVSAYDRVAAVTPDDAAVVNCAGFYVGVGGDVAVTTAGSATPVVLKGCATGALYPIACEKIRETDTTATDIVALY